MFAGHFAASVAARGMAPKLPFWACVGASQLIDIGWGVLVQLGVEKVRIDPALPGSPLDLAYMPWTHSLVMAALWSLAAGLVATRLWGKEQPRAGWWIGAVVFSHWLADLVVHRPDLQLWPGNPLRLGLGLWNLPEVAMLVEIGLLGLAVAWWVAVRVLARQSARPALGWFLAILVLTLVGELPGDPPSPSGMGLLALTGYVAAMLVAWLVDRADRRRWTP
ncbi:metal-dependent hydrolase [Sandarakinorhabdus rubra]|uniref:metal-dependent hydrolase n=1 Tax=Sandarakinorhabdus rubra TaxID=2672568 RepID=UPI0013DA6BBB|nr:hypothetical protein [Sandarakinorhabdus rubra]